MFKNVTNAVTLAGEWYLFKQTASRGVIASLGLIILGAILSAVNDVSYSGPGYFWMFINCCSTASYLLYVQDCCYSTTARCSQLLTAPPRRLAKPTDTCASPCKR